MSMLRCRNSRHLIAVMVASIFITISLFGTLSFAEPGRSVVEDYIYYDNNFNVIQRLRTEEKKKENLMSDEDKRPVAVNLYEINLKPNSSNLTISHFISQSDLEKVRSQDGKIYVPVLESDPLNKIFQLKFGAPRFQTKARKVLSRATYFIEPVGPTGGFFAKFVPHIPGLEQKIEREILVNDYVKSQLPELPANMRDLTMDSFMGVNLSFLGIPHSVAYRSADRLMNKPEGIRVYPGHGLLGCDACVVDYAIKKTGIADSEKAVAKWKQQEFLPKLAKYIAYSHHVLGVSFEAHTQNMVLDIEHDTGEIKKIYFRDFADVLLNPIPLLAEGRLPQDIAWEKVKLMSIHPNYFSDQGVQIAKDIWYHSAIYTGQGVTSHLTGFQRQQRHTLTFLRAYITETEKILGQSIPLTNDAQKVLESLESKASREEFYSGELQERSPLRNAMASILKPIFEFSHKIKIEKIEAELKTAIIDKDQIGLRKAFYKALTLQRVVFMGLDERSTLIGEDTKTTWLKSTLQAYLKLGLGRNKSLESVDFKVLDDRVWAIDRSTQKPMAVTVEAYQEAKTWFQRMTDILRLKPNYGGGAIRCANIFQGVGQ